MIAKSTKSSPPTPAAKAAEPAEPDPKDVLHDLAELPWSVQRQLNEADTEVEKCEAALVRARRQREFVAAKVATLRAAMMNDDVLRLVDAQPWDAPLLALLDKAGVGWKQLQKDGADDPELARVLKSAWRPYSYGGGYGDRAVGGDRPRVWLKDFGGQGYGAEPTLEGPALLKAVRRLKKIPTRAEAKRLAALAAQQSAARPKPAAAAAKRPAPKKKPTGGKPSPDARYAQWLGSVNSTGKVKPKLVRGQEPSEWRNWFDLGKTPREAVKLWEMNQKAAEKYPPKNGGGGGGGGGPAAPAKAKAPGGADDAGDAEARPREDGDGSGTYWRVGSRKEEIAVEVPTAAVAADGVDPDDQDAGRSIVPPGVERQQPSKAGVYQDPDTYMIEQRGDGTELAVHVVLGADGDWYGSYEAHLPSVYGARDVGALPGAEGFRESFTTRSWCVRYWARELVYRLRRLLEGDACKKKPARDLVLSLVDGAVEFRDARRCRVCGCIEEDCAFCIERTGDVCQWVEEDLCSACVGLEPAGDVAAAAAAHAPHKPNGAPAGTPAMPVFQEPIVGTPPGAAGGVFHA